MTKGEVPVRDMGRVGKELGRLEAVLEKQAKVEDKTAEIQDLEEVSRWAVPREGQGRAPFPSLVLFCVSHDSLDACCSLHLTPYSAFLYNSSLPLSLARSLSACVSPSLCSISFAPFSAFVDKRARLVYVCPPDFARPQRHR